MMPILQNTIPKLHAKSEYEKERDAFAEMKREADAMRKAAALRAGQRLGAALLRGLRRLPILVTWLKTRRNTPF